MPDGTIVTTNYNTKFTATVNGSVQLMKIDGVELNGYDDATVELRTGELQAISAAASREAATSTVISEGRSEKDLVQDMINGVRALMEAEAKL